MGSNQPKIVIASPDFKRSSVLKHLLGNNGYKTVQANTPEKSLQRLKENSDLLLLDLSLRDAWNLLRRVKKQSKRRDVPPKKSPCHDL